MSKKPSNDKDKIVYKLPTEQADPANEKIRKDFERVRKEMLDKQKGK